MHHKRPVAVQKVQGTQPLPSRASSLAGMTVEPWGDLSHHREKNRAHRGTWQGHLSATGASARGNIWAGLIFFKYIFYFVIILRCIEKLQRTESIHILFPQRPLMLTFYATMLIHRNLEIVVVTILLTWLSPSQHAILDTTSCLASSDLKDE